MYMMTMALTIDARGAAIDHEVVLEAVLQGNAQPTKVSCSGSSSKDAAEAASASAAAAAAAPGVGLLATMACLLATMACLGGQDGLP